MDLRRKLGINQVLFEIQKKNQNTSMGSSCLSPAVYGRDTPWTGRQSISGQHRDTQNKQPCTPKGNLQRPITSHVFELWEEAGVPGVNLRMHGENINIHVERPHFRSRTQDNLADR
ncbi:hypothetical protein AMECASPLE_033139 [Ameca splendens]|uniref:Uncharacterized protein n=1 Tax=Ameca splendens TaxID=208324 RepID=A0ABV0Y6X9_9TELE